MVTPTLARAAALAASPFLELPTRLVLIRHGQAMHNPRAEAARAEGCSFERFFDIMKEDDAFDAPLTELGKDQAQRGEARFGKYLRDAELLVASPLSRALQTADLMLPPAEAAEAGAPSRVVLESLREINGALLNAKRRERADLERTFHPTWDFGLLPETDESWTEELEPQEECAERGYQSLLWLAKRPERFIVVVAHGGLLQFVLRDHPDVSVLDGRTGVDSGTGPNGDDDGDGKRRSVEGRFSNCEARAFDLEVSMKEDPTGDTTELRPTVILTEVDLDGGGSAEDANTGRAEEGKAESQEL